MFKKLFILALVGGILFLTFIHPPTSRILASRKPVLIKTLELSQYLVVATFKLLWQAGGLLVKFLQWVAGLGVDLWTRYGGGQEPEFDIRSERELYGLYQQVSEWSGLPWQIFWGLHTEETSLGRNLGSTPILSVLPASQKSYFLQICRDLHWDPNQVYGSHKGAIGPFQFIPETWVRHSVDGNGDGVKDPFNVEDAAYSAANYLVYKGAHQNLQKSIWHYNQDPRYVKRVMRYLKYAPSSS